VLADPSGAGVPGATLTLTNQDTTAVIGTQTSDASGNFAFQSVPAPGTYTISAQASGSRGSIIKDIAVTVSERRSVRDAHSGGRQYHRFGEPCKPPSLPFKPKARNDPATSTHTKIGALLARGLNFNGLIRSLPGPLRSCRPHQSQYILSAITGASTEPGGAPPFRP